MMSMICTMTTTTTHLPGQVLSADSLSREILQHITHKWSILVLHCLSQGVHRFRELKQRISGISEKMLAQTLKILEKDGFILRTAYLAIPSKVEYQLTSIGLQVAQKINCLIDWIENNLAELSKNTEKIP